MSQSARGTPKTVTIVLPVQEPATGDKHAAGKTPFSYPLENNYTQFDYHSLWFFIDSLSMQRPTRRTRTKKIISGIGLWDPSKRISHLWLSSSEWSGGRNRLDESANTAPCSLRRWDAAAMHWCRLDGKRKIKDGPESIALERETEIQIADLFV
jgi:hypothetical protein